MPTLNFITIYQTLYYIAPKKTAQTVHKMLPFNGA